MQPIEINDLNIARQLSPLFKGIKRGIEKESLRIRPDGYLSKEMHPEALGATLTNPYLTTDYSEALPEFITQATDDRDRPLQELYELHQFCYQHLGDEILWGASMPCVMEQEKDIPIARYGRSNSAKMKEIYRIGLGHRYGRFMQTIAGVHYNFSLPDALWSKLYALEKPKLSMQDFISEKYMGLIRNYQRYSWLIPLFYGASPALCETFIQGKNIDLEELVPGTRYGIHATSLRMSDLGYQNKVQSQLNVGYNSLDSYISALDKAIKTEDPYYKKMGVIKNGEYQQLNANILQIENEFYGNIRPKRVAISGERPSVALKKYGIEYIEVRALDINPFSPIGIESSQMAFLDSFLLCCLFAKSDPISAREKGENIANFDRVVLQGRHPELSLTCQNTCESLVDVARNILSKIAPFAEMLDQAYGIEQHASVLKQLDRQLDDTDTTFSGRIVKQIESNQNGFFPFAFQLSEQHKKEFTDNPLSADRFAYYQQVAKESHLKQAQMEADDSVSFEAFLASYYE